MPCREPNVGGPMVLGSQTLRAFGSAYWFAPISKLEGPWLGPVYTTIFLTYLAFLLWRGGRVKDAKNSLLRPIVVYYIGVTAFVEVTRLVWDVSRFALVWAALHNLAEWGVIVHTLFSDVEEKKGESTKADTNTKSTKANKAWWWSQLWILLISNWVIFAPTLMEAGLGEQIAGLTCDWLLLIVWLRLYYLAVPEQRKWLKWGLFGAGLHMAEILPLVALLVGLVPAPWVPGCILISITTPITFYCYSRMVDGWEADPAPDLVSTQRDHEHKEPWLRGNKQTGSVSGLQTAGFIVTAVVLSLATLLTPVKIYPVCPPKEMLVPPGQSLSPQSALLPGIGAFTYTSSGIPLAGNHAYHTDAGGWSVSGGGTAQAASNETLCPSATQLTGTTTVWAKTGQEQKLFNMVATMPGPIRAENGNIYYELAVGGAEGNEVKFFESWSSIRSLYLHIYTSKAVSNVFRSEAFADAIQKQQLEGPFKAMIPCTQAQAEAKPVSVPFQFTMDAPIDVLWAKIDNWSNDYSWVQGAQGVTPLTPNLRILHFKTTDVIETRQTNPLGPVEQPTGGHRLIYYMLKGGFLDTIGEAYQGDLTLTPSTQHPGKTIFTYQATVTAKNAQDTGKFEDSVRTDFQKNRIPFLTQWAREAADAAANGRSGRTTV